ncbi:MAG: hypothetical protein U0359_00365 [Byssovorax sp.]
MDDRAFVAEVELLRHRDRVRRAVELGRAARAGDAEARATIDRLGESSEAYERLLALLSVHGSRDGERVVRAIGDVSRTLRSTAARLAPRYCDDAQVGQALRAIVERAVLRRTLARLLRARRRAAIDAFLTASLKESRDPRILDLLPFGSEDVVKAFLAEAREGASPLYYARLVAFHPHFAAAHALAEIQRARGADARMRFLFFSGFTELGRRAPDETLALVRALFDLGEEPDALRGPIGALVRRRPREAFDLLRARHESGRPARSPGAFGVAHFSKVAHQLGADRLEYLVRHAAGTLGDQKRGVRWFLRLEDGDRRAVLRAFLAGGQGGWGAFLFRYLSAASPEERAARERTFERWSRAAQALDGTIAPEVLDFLPRELREVEARRHLDRCEALASKPERRLPYARLLSFASARSILAPFLGHPEGEERARAQRILIACVLHDRAAVGDALANIRARKFEQDPVRLAMIMALAALPVARFGIEQLDAVGGVVQDALDAADLSQATASAVERLVIRLFRVDGAFGARWVARLLAVRGSVSTWGLGDGLTRAEAERLAPALTELAHAWATKERAGAVISLAQSLGIRLGAVTPLLDALERLAQDLPFAFVSGAALGLLAKHDPPRFARLCPAMIAADPSYVLLPVVARHLSLSRQDLLAPLLAPKPMVGRFATGRTHWVIDFGTGFARWTASQQRTYAMGLTGLLADADRDVPTLRFAISTLVRLPFADASAILPYAADPRPPLREMAIRGLPHLDARQGVPVLIEALGDDRARWAIYALRKVFSELRTADVLAELRRVPTTKVTVAKEVVRLLGELGGDEAYRDLLALDRPDLHRDVRIALLRALWDHLERAETWAIFERAVRDPDWIVASKLADVPLGRLSTTAEEKVVALLATILGRAEPEARLDLLKRATYLPLRDEARLLFGRLLSHLGAEVPDEAAAALSAVLFRMRSTEAAMVSKRLVELAPRRKHLLAFIPVLAGRLGPYGQPIHLHIARDLLAALGADPLAVVPYLTLGAKAWDHKQLAEAIERLAGKDLLHHDAMGAAIAAIGACVHPALLEERLRRSNHPAVRRLGLAALVEAARPKHGFTRERRALLVAYQKDPSPAVAGPASFVFPPV